MLIKDPPVEITAGLWMLGTNEYPLYLFQDESEAAVFEGAIGAMGPMAREQLEELGIVPESIKQVIVTHAHPDHVMALPLLRELLPGAEFLASEAAAKTLSLEKAIGFFCKMDGALTDALIAAGMITEQYRPQPFEGIRIAIDRVVGEGDAVTVGGVSFDVLATPGHSDCSLSFYQPDRKILFISDATGYYMPAHGGWWANYFAGYEAYISSMQRLAGLGAEILCLGHHAVIQGADDVASYFRDVIADTRQLHQRILDETEAGKSVREIAEGLGTEVYEKLPLFPLDFYQKNCGLLVKQSLRHEGIEG